MSSQYDILSQRFNTLLIEYKDTYTKFIDVLKTKDSSFVQAENASFIGEKNITNIDNSTIGACLSACSSNTTCTGATFSTTLKNCKLSSGKGNMVKTDNSTAIVYKAMYYIYRLQELNIELTNVVQEMKNASKANYKNIEDNRDATDNKQQIMENNYKVLLDERKEIETMNIDLHTLNAAYDDGNININMYYTNYIVYAFVAVFLVFLLLWASLSSPQYGGKIGHSGSGSGSGSGSKIVKGNYTGYIVLCLVIFIIIIINLYSFKL